MGKFNEGKQLSASTYYPARSVFRVAYFFIYPTFTNRHWLGDIWNTKTYSGGQGFLDLSLNPLINVSSIFTSNPPFSHSLPLPTSFTTSPCDFSLCPLPPFPAPSHLSSSSLLPSSLHSPLLSSPPSLPSFQFLLPCPFPISPLCIFLTQPLPNPQHTLVSHPSSLAPHIF